MTLPAPLSTAVAAMTSAEIEEATDLARDFLRGGGIGMTDARDVALALVQRAVACTVGAPCARHGGAVHGQEAEELRAGVEQILRNTWDVSDDAAADVLVSIRKALIFLLDRVDARDSLAFREATDLEASEPAPPP